MKVIPTCDRILVERIEFESKTAGGIIVPSTAQEKPMQGIILALGPKVGHCPQERCYEKQTDSCCPDRQMDSCSYGSKSHCHEEEKSCEARLKIGQKVLFTKWSGTEVKVDGKDLLVMKESDVLAIIEG